MEAALERPHPPWWQIVLIGRSPRRTLVRVVILVVVCFLLREYAFLPIRVDGISMLPTYKEHGVNVVSRLSFLFHEPQRGDVVAIRMAGEHIMLMKRIVGLPGETVAFHNGQLLINGQPVDEPYIKLRCNWEIAPVQVAPNEYYFVGDNRSMPEGDHTKGRADRKRIVGKALL